MTSSAFLPLVSKSAEIAGGRRVIYLKLDGSGVKAEDHATQMALLKC